MFDKFMSNASDVVNSTLRKAKKFVLTAGIVGSSLFGLVGCDTTGNGGEEPTPLPKPDPVGQVDPKTAISLDKLRIIEVAGIDRIEIISNSGKNFGFNSGDGKHSLKMSTDPKLFAKPTKVGEEFSVLYFSDKPDTAWLYNDNVLTNTFIMAAGKNKHGVDHAYTVSNSYYNNDIEAVIEEVPQRKLYPTVY